MEEKGEEGEELIGTMTAIRKEGDFTLASWQRAALEEHEEKLPI